MKKQILIVLSVITGLLAACSTANFAYYDDIYTSTSEKAMQKAAPNAAQTPAPTAPDGTTLVADSIIYETDENGNLLRTLTYYPGSSEPVITNYTEVADSTTGAAAGSYGYNPDDYYDYSYSSRLRRFHTDVSLGFGYYDPYFTNMYWYDYYPASWGISIYMGYNWWWPNYYYRPYYYSPYWYDYGFRYGWGWYGPYYPCACCNPWYHPHHHGYEPINYYHNHRDPNHAYYYGHRNNIGPSVGNGDRGELPNGRGNPGFGQGNTETNNHYSVTSSPVAFNQRYDNIVAGTTGAGSANHNVGSTNQSARVSNAKIEKPGVSDNPASSIKPVNGNTQPTNNRMPEKPVNSSVSNRTNDTYKTDVKPASPATSTTPASPATPTATRPSATTTTTTTVTRPSATTSATPTTTRPATTGSTTTVTQPAASASSQPTRTVTRTVVTPSSVNTRPATTSGGHPTTTTRPASSRSYPSGNYNSRPSSSSTARPSSSPSSNSGSYNRPSSSSPSSSRPSSSSSSRSNYSSPSSSNRPSSSSTSSSRSSYSSPSRSSSTSSSRSSYSSGSSRSSSGSYGGGGRSGGGYSGGGGHSSGGHSGGRR